MQPWIATILTLAGISWLLFRDGRNHPDTSLGLWVATFWVGIAASKPASLWFDSGSRQILEKEFEGSSLDRNITLALLFFGIVILVRRQINWSKLSAANRALWAFHLFALVSIFWAEYPFVAFKRLIRDVGNIVMILVILSEVDPEEAIHAVFLRCVYILLPLSILVNKYYPAIGVYYNQWTGQAAFSGATVDKNGLGRLALLGGLFLLWSLDRQSVSGWSNKLRQGWPKVILFLLCFQLLRQANSSTSVACLIVGLAVYLVARRPGIRRNRRILVSGAFVLLFGALIALTAAELREIVTTSLGRSPDLTDRTRSWTETMALQTNPLIGVGFASFWTTPDGISLAEKLQVVSAHNGYLETYLNSGLIGTLLLLTVMMAAGRNTMNALIAGRSRGPLFAALFIVGLIYNLSETAFNNTGIVAFILWFLALRYPLESHPPRPQYHSN